jgi:hypothetical protein
MCTPLFVMEGTVTSRSNSGGSKFTMRDGQIMETVEKMVTSISSLKKITHTRNASPVFIVVKLPNIQTLNTDNKKRYLLFLKAMSIIQSKYFVRFVVDGHVTGYGDTDGVFYTIDGEVRDFATIRWEVNFLDTGYIRISEFRTKKTKMHSVMQMLQSYLDTEVDDLFVTSDIDYTGLFTMAKEIGDRILPVEMRSRIFSDLTILMIVDRSGLAPRIIARAMQGMSDLYLDSRYKRSIFAISTASSRMPDILRPESVGMMESMSDLIHDISGASQCERHDVSSPEVYSLMETLAAYTKYAGSSSKWPGMINSIVIDPGPDNEGVPITAVAPLD